MSSVQGQRPEPRLRRRRIRRQTFYLECCTSSYLQDASLRQTVAEIYNTVHRVRSSSQRIKAAKEFYNFVEGGFNFRLTINYFPRSDRRLASQLFLLTMDGQFDP